MGPKGKNKAISMKKAGHFCMNNYFRGGMLKYRKVRIGKTPKLEETI
jgi:hypothetical protein